MVWQIVIAVVQVHKRPIYAWHALEHILQALPQIMAVPQTHPLIEHDVHLHIQLVARMIRLQALNLLDRVRKAHGQVQQDVAVRGRGGGAGEVTDVGGGGAGPVDDDVEAEEQAAEGVEPPDGEGGAEDGEDDAEDVEDDVGHGVLGEGLDAGVLDEAAPEPAARFYEDGAGHDDDGGEAEGDDAVVRACKPVEALQRDLEEGGDHDDGEDEDADGFEAAPPDGVGGLVLAGD